MTQGLEIYAVRHGETNWNRKRIIQGHKNTKLSKLGREQARDMAQSLKELDFDQIVCSDLTRCRETASFVQELKDTPIGYTKLFRERSFGELEGLTWKEAKAQYPEVFEDKNKFEVDHSGLGIEHYIKEFSARIFRGLDKLPKRYPSARKLLLVTHGGVMRVLLKRAEGEGKTFIVTNCSVYRFLYRDGELTRLTT